MRYSFRCREHGIIEHHQSIRDPVPATIPCPDCQEESPRDYRADLSGPPIYNAQGFHKTDYFPGNVGSQPADRKEWLNSNWSKHYGEPPPKPDSAGTYDGKPK